MLHHVGSLPTLCVTDSELPARSAFNTGKASLDLRKAVGETTARRVDLPVDWSQPPQQTLTGAVTAR